MFEGEYFNMYNAYGSVKLSTFPELPFGEQFPSAFFLSQYCLILPLLFLQTFYFFTPIQYNIFSIFFFLSFYHIIFLSHIYLTHITLICRMGNECTKIIFRSLYTITYLILLWVIDMAPPRKCFSLGISDVFLNIRQFAYFFNCKIYQ